MSDIRTTIFHDAHAFRFDRTFLGPRHPDRAEPIGIDVDPFAEQLRSIDVTDTVIFDHSSVFHSTLQLTRGSR